MPSRALIAACLALIATDAGAAVPDRPRILPDRDVTVQYAVTSNEPGIPQNVTVRMTADGHVRIETPGQGYLLYASGASKARWVMPQGGLYIELPVGASLAGPFVPSADARFTRAGEGTVAGLSCTQWRVSAPRGGGTACVTADGVILKGEGGDGRGHTGSIVATQVAYAPQPAALFEPPPGAQRLSLPGRLPSLPRANP
jgi:hypothetical protein